MAAFVNLQRENVALKRKITESATQSNLDMQMDLLRSQFEKYQKIHTHELHMFKNLLSSTRFETKSEIIVKTRSTCQVSDPHGIRGGHPWYQRDGDHREVRGLE